MRTVQISNQTTIVTTLESIDNVKSELDTWLNRVTTKPIFTEIDKIAREGDRLLHNVAKEAPNAISYAGIIEQFVSENTQQMSQKQIGWLLKKAELLRNYGKKALKEGDMVPAFKEADSVSELPY